MSYFHTAFHLDHHLSLLIVTTMHFKLERLLEAAESNVDIIALECMTTTSRDVGMLRHLTNLWNKLH